MNHDVSNPSLVLPDLLQGQWTSAVILTYSADLGFFEQCLAGQLSQVPLRIILGDGRRIAERLAEAATTGQQHKMINRSYLVAPIRHLKAAHSKLILLLGPHEGVLVVGSGNLGNDGYASPGELWHVFRYDDERSGHLSEFASARNFIDGLASRQLLDSPAAEILPTLWGTAPWLPTAPAATTLLRHNLEEPLIDQFAAAVPWPVREMVAHAPFYDPDCAALVRLIEMFAPERLRVLVSRGTSVDPEKLAAAVAKTADAAVEIVEVGSDPSTYIHAKWIHLKGDALEAALTGSANLSRSALMLTAAKGNIETAIIAVAGTGAFAGIDSHLLHSEVNDLASVGLSYKASEPPGQTPERPVVLWSRLEGRRLTIMFDRPFDDDLPLSISSFSTLEIGWTSKRLQGQVLELELDDHSVARVADGGALAIQVGQDASEPSLSWPYQLAAIRGRLDKGGGRDQLQRIGDLPERDADLYALLQELESTLIFDALSIWRVARPRSEQPPSDDVGQTISWQDLDWNRVRRDLRFTGYLTRDHSAGVPPSDIQLILAAITGRLGEFGSELVTQDISAEESELANEASQDASDAAETTETEIGDELARATVNVTSRTRAAFSRFVKRYTAATRDQAFIDELGPIVSIKNAVIFSHLLARLLERDAVDPDRAVEAQVATWRVLWGAGDTSGLVAKLTAVERDEVQKLLENIDLRVAVLRSIAATRYIDLNTVTRTALRDQVRYLIVVRDFDLDAALITAAEPQPELAEELLATLSGLARRSTPEELIDFVLAPFSLTHRSAERQQHNVRRRAGRGYIDYRADVLVVLAPIKSFTTADARKALERLEVANALDGRPGTYLRIRFAGNGSDVAYWDPRMQNGIVMVQGKDEEFNVLHPPWPDWLAKLDQLSSSARFASRRGAARGTTVA